MIIGNDGAGSKVGGELPADLLGDGVLLGLDEGLEYASDGGFDVFLGHFRSQVHLGSSCIREELPTATRMIDSM